MNTFAIGSLPVHFSVAKLFTFRWQYTLVEIESQLAGVLVHPCTGPALQLLNLMRIRRHTDGLELTELPRTLVHHDHADRARFVSAPADKHARKGSQSEAIHP